MEKRTQPCWNPPKSLEPTTLPELRLLNSLTMKKNKFVPQNGKNVKWYTCGPTVYDFSHMGHARTYIAFDALRRVLKDYFLFNVTYVLNITDVDDKIIKRARQNHLMNEYMKLDKSLVDVYEDLTKAVRNLKEKSVSDPDPDKRSYLSREVDRIVNVLGSQTPRGEDPIRYLALVGRDAIADLLDQKFGASMTDHAIFGELSKHFEAKYHEDMAALNVLKPDVLVRVTEHIDSIIRFVQRIIDNGFGYVSLSGSVYFDTNKFASDPNHFYGKLVPTAYGDAQQLASGEGELTSFGEKQSLNDFALWKSSKQGEPSWPSPWGFGRPGWHIECSAMASAILGDSMDIHCGGVDLRFPHHDNELAQSEAYFGHSHWVHYFLHSGHLTIAGCKMSKSLKNFITIQDALKEHSSRRLRLLFLLHSWHDTMDYSDDTMAEAINYEKMLVDFLFNAANLQLLAQTFPQPVTLQNQFENDTPLLTLLKKTQYEVYDALCDSCDIRRVLLVLKEFICMADQHAVNLSSSTINLIQAADEVYLSASFVLRVLRVLGVAEFTLASKGTPVPIDGIVAGGKISADQQPLQLDSCAAILPSLRQRYWLSLDAPTLERVRDALYSTLKSTQTLANSLLAEGSMFSNVVADFAISINERYGVDIFNLPASASSCLTMVFENTSNKCLSKSVNTVDGIETEVWATVAEFLLRLTLLRQNVRVRLLTVADVDKTTKQRILSACDRMRDKDLVYAGIRLQDRVSVADLAKGTALPPCIGLVDRDILLKELSERDKRSHGKLGGKPGRDLAAANLQVKSPVEFFKSQLDKYSAFDDKGIPTHDASGKEISKSQIKKLKKLFDIQCKRYDAANKIQSTIDSKQ